MILEAEGLSKLYGEREILSDITFSVKQSEIILIKGRSGAGKSTLLNLVSLLEIPDSGKIILNGSVVTKKSDLPKLRRKNFGFLFQDLFLMEELDALDNVILSLAVSAKEPKVKWPKLAGRMLDQVGIETVVRNLPVRLLSGGERARIAFARSVVHSPLICFCDEPTGNLDADNALVISNLIAKVSQLEKTSFVIVSHSTCFDAVSNAVYGLENGRLIPKF